MKTYSLKMQEIFKQAQFHAERFGSHYLESWHILLAMVAVDHSLANLVLSEFDQKIAVEEYEAAAILAMGKSPKEVTDMSFKSQSKTLTEILQLAQAISQVTGDQEIGSEHVLFAILLKPDTMASRLLEMAGYKLKESGKDELRMADLRKAIEVHAGYNKETIKAIHDLRKPKKAKSNGTFSEMMKPQSTAGDLSDFTRDLTEMASQGLLEPVIGRDKEVSRMIQVLSRKTKNNPVLVGDAGVGKTALAYGLAQRIVNGAIPYELQDMRVLELDMMSVVAGTRFRGDFEERMNQIIDDIEADGHIILFVDELHTIMGSGSGIDSTLDAANILKPALSRGTLHMVGATTQEEYQKHIEKDAALSRRFAKVLIEEPSVEDAYQILVGLRSSYELYHNVSISDQALQTAVKMAKRYLTSKNLPDSAIDLLDEASATVQSLVKKESPSFITPLDQALLDGDMKKASALLAKTKKGQKKKPTPVTEEDIMSTLSKLSGIPVEKMTQADSKNTSTWKKNCISA